MRLVITFSRSPQIVVAYVVGAVLVMRMSAFRMQPSLTDPVHDAGLSPHSGEFVSSLVPGVGFEPTSPLRDGGF